MTIAQQFVKDHSNNNNFLKALFYASTNFWDSDLWDNICDVLKCHFPVLQDDCDYMATLIAEDIREGRIDLDCEQVVVSFPS